MQPYGPPLFMHRVVDVYNLWTAGPTSGCMFCREGLPEELQVFFGLNEVESMTDVSDESQEGECDVDAYESEKERESGESP